ncbi:hypothetical protein [Microvirgula curvata]
MNFRVTGSATVEFEADGKKSKRTFKYSDFSRVAGDVATLDKDTGLLLYEETWKAFGMEEGVEVEVFVRAYENGEPLEWSVAATGCTIVSDDLWFEFY